MKTSNRPGKDRKKRVAAKAKPAFQHPKKAQSSKTAEIEAIPTTTLEKTGQHYPTWQIHKDWPNLFTISKMEETDERSIYRVEMDEDLEARFSALGRGNTNAKVAALHKALFLLHLCKVDEVEFGSSTQMFLSIEPNQPSDLAQIHPFCIEQLQRALEVVELLKSSLSAELAKIVYADQSAAAAVKQLQKRLENALKLFSAPVLRSAKKQNAQFYPYQNKEVSLPWLAIELANLFVREHHQLPTKIELRESAERAVREEANKAAQARKAASQASKEAEQANREAELAAKTVVKLVKPISRSTWSDALKTAGLTELPEGEKFSSLRYKKPPTRQKCTSFPNR